MRIDNRLDEIKERVAQIQAGLKSGGVGPKDVGGSFEDIVYLIGLIDNYQNLLSFFGITEKETPQLTR